MTTEKRNEAAGGSKREKERAGSHGGFLSAQSVCMHKKRNERNEREKVPAHASSQQSAAGDATERTQSAKEMNANDGRTVLRPPRRQKIHGEGLQLLKPRFG